MTSIVPFSVNEDMQIWKFAIADHDGNQKQIIWQLLVEKTGSFRNYWNLSDRFQRRLLPHLPKTHFHVETKLKLCRKFMVFVSEKFLESLTKHADVKLDEDRFVIGYKLKPGCPENKDMELSDEKFMEITSPIIAKCILFTPEEDAEIWKYVVDNYETFNPGSTTFWKNLAQTIDSDRSFVSVRQRFFNHLAPKLHLQDYDIETKLKLYLKFSVAVNKNYLKTLKKHAELFVRKNYIIDYKMNAGGAEKRKMPKESDGNQKKARVGDQLNDSFEATEDDELNNTLDPSLDVPEVGNFEEIDFDNDGNQFPVRGDGKEQVMEQGVVEKNNFKTVAESQKTDENQQKPSKIPEVQPVPKSAPEQVPDETPENINADVRISNKMILEFMQKMENSPKELEAVFKREMTEMYKAMDSMKDEMNGSRRSEVSEMKKRMCEMKKDLEASFDKKISRMSKTMDSTKEEVESLRNLIQSDDVPGSGKKKGLMYLQKFISSLNAPELEAIEHRIEAMIQNQSDSDETSIVSEEALKNVLEAVLTLIGL